MASTSASTGGHRPTDSSAANGGAAHAFFSSAGFTDAAIRALDTAAKDRLLTGIVSSEKLTPTAARELSEVLKRDHPPFSEDSLRNLFGICQIDLVRRDERESAEDFLRRQQNEVELVVRLIRRTYDKPLAGQENEPNPETRKVACLDKQALDALLECVAKGPMHAEITLKVLRAVSTTSPNGEAEALSLLKTHRGNWSILERVFTAVSETYDIFKAAQGIQVISGEGVREEARAAGQIKATGEEAPGAALMRESVTLASGPVSTSDDIHCFMSAAEPGKAIFLGGTATPHLAETLYGGKYRGKVLERRREDRQRRAHETFADITLEDVLADRSLAKDIKSPLVGRALRLYDDLVAEQQRLRNEILEELKAVDADRVIAFLAKAQLRADDGGFLLRRVERAIKAGEPAVSQAVRTAYENLASPYTDLGIAADNPEAQNLLERECWRTLALWTSHQECIQTEIVLKPHLDDIEEWRKLPPSDPLKARYASLEQLAPVLENMSAGSAAIMTHAAYGELLVQHDLLGLRQALNERLWNQYGDAVKAATDRLRILFKDKNRWREDCIPLGVIPKRVHDSLWGAKIAVEPGGKDEKRATISDKELRAVERAESLLSSYPSGAGLDSFLRITSVTEFRDVLRTCAYCLTKADAIAHQISDYNRKQRIDEKEQVTIDDPFNVTAQLSQLEKVRPRVVTRSISGKEGDVGLEQEINPSLPEGMTLVDLGRRLAGSKYDHRLGDYAQLEEIAREAQSGIYSHKNHAKILEIAPALAALRHEKDPEIEDTVTRARKIAAAPLVVSIQGSSLKPDYKNQYFAPDEIAQMRRLVEEEEAFKDAFLNMTQRSTAAQEARSRHILDSFYAGEFVDGKLTLGPVDSSELYGTVQESPKGSFSYWDLRELERHTAALETAIASGEYVQASTLDAAWFAKAKLACTFEGARQFGHEASERETFFAARGLRPNPRLYISRAFVDAVEQIEELAKAPRSVPVNMERPIGHPPRYTWDKERMLINFTQKRRGHEVLDVAYQSPEFFMNWAPGQQWLEPYAVAIGQMAVEIVNRDFPLPQEEGQARSSARVFELAKVALNRELAEFVAENWLVWFPRKT